MAQRVIDLSLTIEDNMPAHKLFQRPVITTHMSHESTKALNLGVSGDPMTFQTNFIATLDHVGTHVDAFRHVNAKGQPVDEMPLDLFMGKALCFDLRHIPDLGDITAQHMEEAEKKAGVTVNGHIALLCTGFHKRTYPIWTRCGRTRRSPSKRPVGFMSADPECMALRARRPTSLLTTYSRNTVFAVTLASTIGNGWSTSRSCLARASFNSLEFH